MQERDQGCRHRSTQKFSMELVKKVRNKNARGTRLEKVQVKKIATMKESIQKSSKKPGK